MGVTAAGVYNWFEALLTVPGAGTGIIGELLFDGIVSTAPAPGLVPLIGGAEMISFAPKGFCGFCVGEP